MANIDVFRGDAFSEISLTAAIEKIDYVPQFLLDMPGLFVDTPVDTTDIWIETRDGGRRIIQTSERGAPPSQTTADKRQARSFRTRRLADSSTIYAHQIQNIRAFGRESELQRVQEVVAERYAKMMGNQNLTKERLCLGAIQGIVKDKDDSVIYNWATEFGVALPTEIAFDLDAASPEPGAIRMLCNDVVRGTSKALKGLGGAGFTIGALAGDDFYDELTNSGEVRETFLNWQAAAELREGNAWTSFRYGGINWFNYRGTDDGTTVAIPADKVKFFPVNAGIFQMAYSPGESMEFVNTPGKPFYANVVVDRDRNSWVQPELYSYPLPVCVVPEALFSGRAGG